MENNSFMKKAIEAKNRSRKEQYDREISERNEQQIHHDLLCQYLQAFLGEIYQDMAALPSLKISLTDRNFTAGPGDTYKYGFSVSVNNEFALRGTIAKQGNDSGYVVTVNNGGQVVTVDGFIGALYDGLMAAREELLAGQRVHNEVSEGSFAVYDATGALFGTIEAADYEAAEKWCEGQNAGKTKNLYLKIGPKGGNTNE